jgi:hypothetical protein
MATIKDLKRMCLFSEFGCVTCPLGVFPGPCYPDFFPDNIDDIVDKWVAEHPIKTYAMDLFEKFPNALKVEEDGTPKCCWKFVYGDASYICESDCAKCWNREMKEDE